MAIRYAVASGIWSSTSTWNSGATLGLPTASDDVYASNQRITIDTNISVLSLRNSATGSAVAQGTYVINNGVTITSPTIISSTGSMMLISQSNSATIVGNLSTTTTTNAICLTMSATSSLTITGSISAGNGTNTRGIVNTSSGTLIITGSVTNVGGSSTAYTLLKQTSAGTVIITGSVFAGTATPIRNEQNATSYYILGNLVGGGAACFLDAAGGAPRPSLYIIGNIYGSTAGTIGTVYITGNPAFISVSGSLIASSAEAIYLAAGTAVVNGAISASQFSPAISTTTGIVQATGPFIDVDGTPSVYSPGLQLIPSSSTSWTFSTETTKQYRTLYTDRNPQTYPSASNVRSGSVYGASNEITGVVIIPPVGFVTQGVLVDNETGSASFTIQNAWTTPTSSLSGSAAIGTRLKNTATVANVAAAVASKGTI